MTATSKKIQRYRPRQNPKWGEDLMEKVPNGGYVLQSDYAALEQQALRMAEDLYQFGNWKDMKEGYWYCVQCGASWMPGAKQNHKADCLIALAESIIHQHNESEKGNDQKAL